MSLGLDLRSSMSRPHMSVGRSAAHVVAWLALLAIVTSLLAPVASAQDEAFVAPTKVWVQESGHTVDQTFLRDWRSYQMLIGDPISQEVRDRVKIEGLKTRERTLQYFENVVLVSTGDDDRSGDSWHVQALPVGEWALERDAEKLAKEDIPSKGTCEGFSEEDCLKFEETGHTVKLGFKGYWDTNKGEQLLGPALTEEFVAANGWTTQYFRNGVLRWNEDQGIVPDQLGKRAAKRDKIETAAINQPDGIPVYSEAIFSPAVEVVEVTTPSGPGPIQGGYKEIVVSISQQYMWAYEDGLPVIETYVSTGTAETIEVTTPVGYWSILSKYDVQSMEGTISNEYYFVPDVPWVMYFDNLGNAIHGAYWHNNFGTPMSHGCVNLPLYVAEFLYGWAPVGTLVTVIG
jgi:hypothetical protein